jgi:hypothetical protein
MVKAGKNGSGKQRYKCSYCNSRTVIKKETTSKQNELKMFVNWLIDSTKIDHITKSSRSTFYRKTNWCWSVIPKIKSEGIPSDFIFVDATHLNGDNYLLIVRNEKVVLNYIWAEKEDSESYCELLRPLQEPRFVICDGHSAIAKASLKLWKNVMIQRCIVHVIHNAERKLGKRNPPEVNRLVKQHIKKLAIVDTKRKAVNWQRKWAELYAEHKDYIGELSFTVDPDTGEVIRKYPAHANLRSVCNEINKLLKKDRLFLFVEHGIPNNTNHLEGGINSPLKNLLRCHRGLVLEHQKLMWEWYLLSRSATPLDEYFRTLDLDVLYPKNDN